jgi:predicted transcriptional regulator
MLATSDHPCSVQSALSVTLGSLEAQVMEVLWTRGECKVREVMRTLDRDLAYTTVMTTLDRLFRKKLVDRRKSTRAYIYSPRLTCQEWKNRLARDVVARLLAGPQSSREALIACLLEAVGTQDALLLEFQKEIRKRRSRSRLPTN